MEETDDKTLGLYSFEDALDISGVGKYTYTVLSVCCLLILEMCIDMFGMSVMLPSLACDLDLTTKQQGTLSAIPLVGVMVSSYAWGLCTDTLGRRKTMVIAMPIGLFFNLVISIAPNFTTLCLLKFLSAGFTSSANAAAFVLLGETVPRRLRSRFMFVMASATMVGQLFTSLPALPVFTLKFHISVPWLAMEYRPWRLLMQILCIPGVLGIIGLSWMDESPKFLLSKSMEDKSLAVLKRMYHFNTGLHCDKYPVRSIRQEKLEVQAPRMSLLLHMWNQTAPLFRTPLLRNSLVLYFILLCAYMTSTGFTMWVPTMTNVYLNGDNNTGMTFCEVLTSTINATRQFPRQSDYTSSAKDCDNVIKQLTLYAVMVYSGVCGALNLVLAFIVGPLGKKRTTLLVFTVCIASGIVLMFIRVPMLSILLFYVFPYVALILGNINSYLVELNPTNLRGMATCLSVMVARGFGFISVQLIGLLLVDHCEPMIAGYIVLVLLGLITACFLPSDAQGHSKIACSPCTEITRKQEPKKNKVNFQTAQHGNDEAKKTDTQHTQTA